jgi:hypothetical protein
MKRLFIVTIILPSLLFGMNKANTSNIKTGGMTKKGWGSQDYKAHNIGDIWSMQSNFGNYGDADAETKGTPSYTWPGGTPNFYLWEGRLWIGTKIGGEMYVSHADYGNYELWPVDEPDWSNGWGFIGKGGTSMWDITTKFVDFYDGANGGRGLGLTIIQKDLAWSVPRFDDFFGYEINVIYNKDNALISSPPDVLRNVFVSICFDADVAGSDPTNRNLDDLVSYDGWTNGEWEAAGLEHGGHYDNLTIIDDQVAIEEPDSVLDYYTIWGDNPDECCLSRPDTIIRNGEPLAVQLIPRNMSYIYDGDNPAEAGDDEGEYGMCPGYIFGRFIYTPKSPSDSVWTDEEGRECRIIRPYSHQWWNWSSDPGTDKHKYEYMDATHTASMGWRFLPHPFDVGAPVFDYRFLLSHGPFEIADGDTLKFVFIGGLGQKLSGGVDEFWGRGALPGARQVSDMALRAYYMGSRNSDPIHPSAPDEDVHWLIPVPPESPNLIYSSGEGTVLLAWDDIAERTPDPMDGEVDFAGYRIYRSDFKVGNWAKTGEYRRYEEYGDTLYPVFGDTIPHKFVDSTAVKGVPYYYAVTSYDYGRPAQIDSATGDTLIPPIQPLESGKTNYKKGALGDEIPVFLMTGMQNKLDKVVVVPNPYVGSQNWERQYEDKIAFMNLPGSCRIKIFSLTGDLIKEIEHTSGKGDEYWDLLSRNNQSVVSGLYIYKIELCDGEGNVEETKVGKFLIIR